VQACPSASATPCGPLKPVRPRVLDPTGGRPPVLCAPIAASCRPCCAQQLRAAAACDHQLDEALPSRRSARYSHRSDLPMTTLRTSSSGMSMDLRVSCTPRRRLGASRSALCYGARPWGTGVCPPGRQRELAARAAAAEAVQQRRRTVGEGRGGLACSGLCGHADSSNTRPSGMGAWASAALSP
jgi:hypothetical protein